MRHRFDTVIQHSITFQRLISAENSAFLKRNPLNLPSAKQILRPRGNETIEDQVKRVQEGLVAICDANNSLGKQLSAISLIISA